MLLLFQLRRQLDNRSLLSKHARFIHSTCYYPISYIRHPILEKRANPTNLACTMKRAISLSLQQIKLAKGCELLQEYNEAELISAMAAGWNAQMIVETWSRGGATSTSIGLSNAIHQTGGRHICIVPNEDSQKEYNSSIMNKITGMSPEIVTGEPEEVMEKLTGIDFLVVDCEKNDFSTILKVAKLGNRGAVLVCKNVSSRAVADFRWRSVLDGKSRIVRSVFLPVGKGMDIAHAVAGKSGSGRKMERKWIRRFDRVW